MILGIDAGNHKVKIAGEYGLMDFISAIGESREINLKQVHGDDDMVFKYEGREGFAGSLALYESEFGGSLMGDSKAHEDAKIRTLIGLHRYSSIHNLNNESFQLILGQPISKHVESEKDKIKQMLIGSHSIEVNGIEKSFNINQIHVAAEGASAFFCNPCEGLVRIIDLGSGTCNYSTMIDGRFVDKESGTLHFGVNTNKTNDINALARGIATNTLKKWGSNDPVFVVGGIAEQIQTHLTDYYPNIQVLHPVFNKQFVSPIYANAIAFYNIAVNVYE